MASITAGVSNSRMPSFSRASGTWKHRHQKHGDQHGGKCLRARGYPGRWLKSVFSDVSYAVERPTALISRPPKSLEEGTHQLHVLKLIHNPLWDTVEFGPIWRTLRDAWIEIGLGRASDRFLASFKKPSALGDTLNKINRETINAHQAEHAATV
jgi:hypothetical protein